MQLGGEREDDMSTSASRRIRPAGEEPWSRYPVYWEQFRRIIAPERSGIFRYWDQRYQDTFFQRFNYLRNSSAKRAEVYVACVVKPQSRRIAVEAIFQKRKHGLYEAIREETREHLSDLSVVWKTIPDLDGAGTWDQVQTAKAVESFAPESWPAQHRWLADHLYRYWDWFGPLVRP